MFKLAYKIMSCPDIQFPRSQNVPNGLTHFSLTSELSIIRDAMDGSTLSLSLFHTRTHTYKHTHKHIHIHTSVGGRVLLVHLSWYFFPLVWMSLPWKGINQKCGRAVGKKQTSRDGIGLFLFALLDVRELSQKGHHWIFLSDQCWSKRLKVYLIHITIILSNQIIFLPSSLAVRIR